jgi:small nuclear ribonucleoprotein (snRNP)-like protein
MLRKILIPVLLTAAISFASPVTAETFKVDKNATVLTVLKNYQNKKATVKLVSGEELTGTVKAVHANVTHLTSISQKELYDAVIANENIVAVILRVRDK